MSASGVDSAGLTQAKPNSESRDTTDRRDRAMEGELCSSEKQTGGLASELQQARTVDSQGDENQPDIINSISPHNDCDDDNDDDDDDDAVPSNEICVGNMQSGEPDLVKAIRLNHCDKIRQLVRSGHDCNAHCKWDSAPCTVRVKRGHFRKQLQMVGYAPLHVAAIHSTPKTVRCLLTLGAEVNVRDKNERTALQLAVAVNRPRVAQLLIGSGAEINTRSVSGRSPLMEAVTNVSLDLTQTLLGAGANVDLTDIKGTTPLTAVISTMGGRERGEEQQRAQAIVQCLLDAGCEVDRCNPAGATALMVAAGMKVTSILPVLVAAGADVNRADRAGRTSFSMAIEGQRNLTTIKELMKFGAATHVADNKGQTPLSKVLRFGAVSILRLLLSTDAVPHTYDILTAPRIAQLRQYLPEFDAWLQQELYQPRSLLRLCRETVRHQLSPRNLPRLASLGLPRSLNHFVLGVEE